MSRPDGSFELSALQPGERYTLVLGGRGFVGARASWTVGAAETDRDWPVHRLYGARILLLDARGGPLRAVPGLTGPRAGRCVPGRAGLFPVSPRSPGASLAGVDPDWLAGRDSDRRTLLFRSPRIEAAMGPFTFTLDLPGYERAELELELAAVGASLPQLDLLLEPATLDFGSLELQLVGWRGPCEPFPAGLSPVTRLRLVSAQHGSVPVDLGPFDANGRLQIEPLPCGEWRANLSDAGDSLGRGAWSWTGTVEIGAAPARVEVDLCERSVVLVTVLNRAGLQHTGRVRIGLGSPGQRPADVWTFDGPPYRLDVQAGSGRLLELLVPRAGRTVQANVEAVGGECVSVVLQE